MSNNNNRAPKRQGPERGGWTDYVEARLDMRERTERLRALRLRRQDSARQGRDRDRQAMAQATVSEGRR